MLGPDNPPLQGWLHASEQTGVLESLVLDHDSGTQHCMNDFTHEGKFGF